MLVFLKTKKVDYYSLSGQFIHFKTIEFATTDKTL